MDHARQYLIETAVLARTIDPEAVERLATELEQVQMFSRRLFVIGLGGSAANASHAVNDFRRLCAIEAYCASDNVAELTAIANDEGWNGIFSRWLDESNVKENDALLVLSVGGGTDAVSLPLKLALNFAQSRKMRILGIVARDGGYTRELGHSVLVIPTVKAQRITPHAEAFQSVILHCLVSHPKLQKHATKW